MKKTISIISCSAALIASGGISFLSSCTSDKVHHELTPQVRQIREMNPNVKNITVGDFRLQILDDTTVRFEYKYKNPIYETEDWLDDDTLFVPNRTLYPGPTGEVTRIDMPTNVMVSFNDITISIPKNIDKSMKGIRVYQKGVEGPIYNSDNQSDDNQGDLPAPEDTGNVFEVIDYPRIIEPILGYSEANKNIEPYKSHWDKLKDNCGFEIQEHKDIYLTFPHGDAKALRQQYRNLAGAPEMVRLAILGSWDSRYYPYNEQTAQQEVDNYYSHNFPLDNLVIDTDWRAGFDGKGYFVNETLFPNMPRFLKTMRDQNIDVCFNDHPEPQKRDEKELPVLDPQEVEFRRSNLKKIIDMGLDTWWYDRNWSTSLICPGGKSDEHEAMLNHETWGDYLYNNVTKQARIEQATEAYGDIGNQIFRRPTTMSNVVQIRNGVWEGFTDSAAHRYSMQWTGDQTPMMLPTEIQNVVRSGINGMPYMSSDLAGHTGSVADDYYYQRWMEYGALSPIFRIHCTRDLEQHCQPWYRNAVVQQTFRNWVQLRYRLLPLYYSLGREAYDTGMPICRALGFHYKNVPQKYREKEYLIGSNILFAPCDAPETDLIEDDSWINWKSDLQVELYNGIELKGDAVKTTETSFSAFKDMRQYFKDHGVGDDGHQASARITATFQPNDTRCVWLKSDDGVDFKINDGTKEIVHERDWTGHSAKYLPSDVQLNPYKTYTITIEYYNGSEGGSLEFAGAKIQKRDRENKVVFLPKGQWLDLFHGDIYNAGKFGLETPEITYRAQQNALFIKLGTMIPLIQHAQNTKAFDWTNLAFDYYPSKEAEPFASSLYEDDFETTAYQYGYYHNTPYQCYYDKDTSEYVVKIDPSEGSYVGDDFIADRTYKIRVHKSDSDKFGGITLDGKFLDPKKDINIIPMDDWYVETVLNFDGASRTEDVWEIEIPRSSIRTGHILRIKVGA